MSDQLALFIAGLGNMIGAVTLVIAPTAPTPPWMFLSISLCAAIGTAALLRSSSK
jgi:hypothetical protein